MIHCFILVNYLPLEVSHESRHLGQCLLLSQVMLELFGTKELELVACLEFSNRVITEKVGASF